MPALNDTASPAFAKKFWSRVVKRGPRRCDCWEWIGARRRKKWHGTIKIAGRRWITSRVAWILKRGPIPKGLCVLHKCDNPICVRLSHLFLGTKGDNNRDRSRKGRSCYRDRQWTHLYPERRLRGERVGTSKLKWRTIRRIRRLYASGTRSQDSLAAQFGVSQHQIHRIVRLKQWVAT